MADKSNWGNAPQESTTTGRNGWGNAPQESTTTGRNGWGNAPQESTTTGRNGWGNAPQESTTTGRSGWSNAPQKSTTPGQHSGTNAQPRPSQPSVKAPEYNFYVIDGITYTVQQLISTKSGEAKIFKVASNGRLLALKLYHSNISPNHAILDKIQNMRGTGLIIDIYSHGKWLDPKTKITHDYEIMQYCEGGSLANLKLKGDEALLEKLAIWMSSAVDLLHKNNILHRDVKPANFLWVDQAHTRIVLSDWGFAKMLDGQKRVVSDGARTIIYAAPEMYTANPGEAPYVEPKSDFYSIGMTLLSLWIGEYVLNSNEDELREKKLDGNLPYPSRTEMSEHSLSLLKALTQRNIIKRAGFSEIVKWAKGENIFDEEIISEFKIVFSAAKNLIAHSPKELAEMMWDNTDIAKNYLYKGHLINDLNAIKYHEYADAMEDIIEKEYPDDQLSGVFVACLTLYPEMKLYLRCNDDKVYGFNTLDDIANALSTNTIKVNVFGSNAVLAWAATRNRQLAGKAIAERKRKGSTDYTVTYALFPDRAFDFKPIKNSSLATPEQIGQRILDEISGITVNKDCSILDSLNSKFKSSRLYAYLASKGIYQRQIDWITYCLDVDSQDNTMKYGPYNNRIAIIKAATGLTNGKGHLTINGHKLTTYNDLKIAYPNGCKKLLESTQSLIADWMATKFQEDPYANLKNNGYYNLTVRYVDAITDNTPGCLYYQAGVQKMYCLKDAKDTNKKERWKLWLIRIFSIISSLILLATCYFGTMWALSLGFSESSSSIGTTIAAIIAGLIFLGNMDDNFWGGIIGAAVTYVIIKLICTYLMLIVVWGVIAALLVTTIVLTYKIWAGNKIQSLANNSSSMGWDEINDRFKIGACFNSTSKVFPRGVAYNYPINIINENTHTIKESIRKVRKNFIALIILSVISLSGLAAVHYKPDLLTMDEKVEETSEPTAIDLMDGDFTGYVKGTPLDITFIHLENGGLQADMTIHYRSGKTVQSMVTPIAEGTPLSLYKTDSHAIYLLVDLVMYSEGRLYVSGSYRNSKGNIQNFKVSKEYEMQ